MSKTKDNAFGDGMPTNNDGAVGGKPAGKQKRLRKNKNVDNVRRPELSADASPAVVSPATSTPANVGSAVSPADVGSTDSSDWEARDTAVLIEDVSMVFNIASEQLNSLKEYFIKLMRRELFFKEFRALSNISLTVKRGDVVGIVGTNGSGKSTLLKIVAGVLEPSQGQVGISGSIAPLIELGAGFDFEMSARENIYLNGALLGYSKEFIDQHFDSIVDFAEMRDFLDLPMKNYSSGMVARIAFAIATVIVPDILIVDETLSVGDMFFQEKCEARIKALIEDDNTTVLFVSHDINQVERICRKVIWIEHGVQKMYGSTDEVCEAYRSSHSG
jgi:ABC-2 type transport system ATP-binding protein